MSSTTSQNSILRGLSDEMAGAVERAGQSLARVEARRSNPASGIVWSADGFIVTAHHVIERPDTIQVALADGRELAATLVGRDPGSDLAVLRVEASDLTPAPRDDGNTARVGHLALAVARPHGLAATIGVVSTVGGPWRTWRGGQIEQLIQTDAPFHPGFSGGGLIDASGNLLGVISSQLGRGLNLAVPTALAEGIVATLTKHGQVRRGYLGVGMQPVALPASLRERLGMGQETGLLVVTVEPNGPADQGGLLLGDIIIGLAGQAVGGIDELQARLSGDRIGQATPTRIIRGGAIEERSISIGERQPASETGR